MRDIAQVFRTLWERAGEFNSVPILTPKLIPLGDYGRITNRNAILGRAGCQPALPRSASSVAAME
jgi:hypothetical protein